MLELLHWFGGAVCHQLPSRSYSLGSLLQPLCSRCSGIYFGAGLGYLYIALGRRYRHAVLPQLPVLVLLIAAIGLTAIDALSVRFGYRTTTDTIRYLTGLFCGVALPIFLFPIGNQILLSLQLRLEKTVAGFCSRDLGQLLLVVGAGALLQLGGGAIGFWVVALLSIVALCTLYLHMNTVIYAVLFGKEELVTSAKDLVRPLLFAVLLATAELYLLRIYHGR